MQQLQWKYVKPLPSMGLVSDFEKAYAHKFEQCFVDYIHLCNGGRPHLKAYDTDKTQRLIKLVFSFNKADDINIWDANEWAKDDIGGKYIAFANDDFGNLICFEKGTNNVVFWNHDTDTVEFIAKGFEAFINALYKPE